jgi:hypothetical protein
VISLYRFPRFLSSLALLLLTLVPPSLPSAAAPSSQQSRPILLTDPVPDPRQAGVQYFAATGHTLRGAFWDYWHRYGGLAQFGYPITKEFFEPSGGPDGKEPLQVQYFERSRFEFHPENAGTPSVVLLGRLGATFHSPDPPAAPLPGAQYFQETGHNLSGPFKAYWDTHGGLFVHGYPITEQFEEANPINHKTYTVQYFERSRFELHLENAGTEYEVLLGMLSTQLAQKNGYPYGWYPLYGRAADWSWVAGQYRGPFLMCPDCLCDTLHYVQGARYYDENTSVQPIGPGWKAALEPSNGRVHNFGLIVLFGHSTTNPLTCFAPDYFVDQVRRNPSP